MHARLVAAAAAVAVAAAVLLRCCYYRYVMMLAMAGSASALSYYSDGHSFTAWNTLGAFARQLLLQPLPRRRPMPLLPTNGATATTQAEAALRPRQGHVEGGGWGNGGVVRIRLRAGIMR